MKFTLTTPIEFTNNGEFDKAYEIEFVAPSFKDRAAANRLNQCFMRAMMDGRKFATDKAGTDSKGETSELTGAAVGMMLLASDQDYDGIVSEFCDLAPSVGSITETVNLRREHIQRMDINDVNRMCNEYIAFFIAPSLFSMMSGDSTS